MRDGVLVSRIGNRCGSGGDRRGGRQWPIVKTKFDLLVSYAHPHPEPYFLRLRCALVGLMSPISWGSWKAAKQINISVYA